MTAALEACARPAGPDLVISVRVSPRARHDEIGGVKNGALQIRTTSPPADGKANKAVIRLLAAHLGVAPSRIKLLRGRTCRDKRFLVKNCVNGL